MRCFSDSVLFSELRRQTEETIKNASVRISDAEYVKKAWELQDMLYDSISENKTPPALNDI